MGGVSPETCWAIKKHWNNKFHYTVAPCWFFLWVLYYDARIHEYQTEEYTFVIQRTAGPSGRAVYCVVLRPLVCLDCGFESHRGHGCLSVVKVVCCQVEVSASGLITRPEESCRLWCVVVCDLETSWIRRPWPTGGAVAPKEIKYIAYHLWYKIRMKCMNFFFVNFVVFKSYSTILKHTHTHTHTHKHTQNTVQNIQYVIYKVSAYTTPLGSLTCKRCNVLCTTRIK
jgi:hypothetical protein